MEVKEIKENIIELEKREDADDLVKKIKRTVGVEIRKKITVRDDGKVEAEIELNNEIAVAKTDEGYVTAEFFNTKALLSDYDLSRKRKVCEDINVAEEWLNEREEEVKKNLIKVATEKEKGEKKLNIKKLLVVE